MKPKSLLLTRFAILLVFVSIILEAIKPIAYDLLDIRPPSYLIVQLGILTYTIAIIFILYLRGDIHFPFLNRFIANQEFIRVGYTQDFEEFPTEKVDSLRSGLASLEARLAAMKSSTSNVAIEDTTQILESLQKYVDENLARQISDELEKRFIENYGKGSHIGSSRMVFNNSAARLEHEIAAITRRGNLNLVIGAITSIAAVSSLFYMIPQTLDLFKSWQELISYYIPRLTIVVIIEVFGYFFLRLYKTSIMEIKYYQNELTILANKRIAFEVALSISDDKPRHEIVSKMIHQEANNANCTPRGKNPENEKELLDLLERATKLIAASSKK